MDELRARAKAAKIPGWHKMREAALVAALRAKEDEQKS